VTLAPDRIAGFVVVGAAMLAAEVTFGFRAGRTPFSLFDQIAGWSAAIGSLFLLSSNSARVPWAAVAASLFLGLVAYAATDTVLRRRSMLGGSVTTLQIFFAWAAIGTASLVPAYILHVVQ
jgi:hypothetical protein